MKFTEANIGSAVYYDANDGRRYYCTIEDKDYNHDRLILKIVNACKIIRDVNPEKCTYTYSNRIRGRRFGFKRVFIIIALFISAVIYAEVNVNDNLLSNIARVESSNNPNAINVRENAVGLYQIRPEYLKDVNRILKSQGMKIQYTLQDRYDSTKAKNMVIIYLTYYGKRYEKNTGKKCSNEVLARIHNGGPKGYKNSATVKYWNKVNK